MLLVGVVCEPVLKVKLPAHQQQFLMQNRAAGAEQQSLRERRAHLTDHHTFSRLLACSLFYSNPHRLVRVENMLH